MRLPYISEEEKNKMASLPTAEELDIEEEEQPQEEEEASSLLAQPPEQEVQA
jgi:hypothetical protein